MRRTLYLLAEFGYEKVDDYDTFGAFLPFGTSIKNTGEAVGGVRVVVIGVVFKLLDTVHSKRTN